MPRLQTSDSRNCCTSHLPDILRKYILPKQKSTKTIFSSLSSIAANRYWNIRWVFACANNCLNPLFYGIVGKRWHFPPQLQSVLSWYLPLAVSRETLKEYLLKRYLPGLSPPPYCWPKPSSSARESRRVPKRCLIIDLLLEVTTIQFSRVLQRCLRSTHQELGSLRQIWRTCSFTLTKKWDLSNRIHMEHTSNVTKNLRRSCGTLDWSHNVYILYTGSIALFYSYYCEINALF